MKLAGDLEQRLSCSIQRAFYRVVRGPDPVVVEETAQDGQARIELDAGALTVEWQIQGKVFGFLRDAKNADGALFVVREGDEVEVHVFECKRTVTQESWGKAKIQMRWTLLRLFALAGVLGLKVVRVTCYTAYCADEIEPDSSPHPIAGKVMTGDADDAIAPDDVEDVEARRRLFDWEGERVRLRDFESPFAHKKLPLDLRDGVAVGAFALAAL
jgi:hypothetical protein